MAEMGTVLRLQIAVGLLTRNTMHKVTDPVTGADTYVTWAPLLSQLAAAVKNTSAGAAFKSGNVHAPLPLSADALDLLTHIDEVATEHWWMVHRLHFGEGRGTLPGRIRAWAMAAQADPSMARDAEHILSGWVDQIRALLEPTRRVHIRAQCPRCKAERARRDVDGETVMDYALYIRYSVDGEPLEAGCGACGVTWEWRELAREMGLEVNDD